MLRYRRQRIVKDKYKMGQLRTLVWKNFKYCNRHRIRTALFFIVPVAFSCFIFLIVALIEIDNEPDCDYETLALPPSSPILITNSLVCSSSERCQNKTRPPHELYYGLTDPEKLCAGGNVDNETELKNLFFSRAMACNERNEDIKYRQLFTIDLVFRGKLFYYPKNSTTDKLIERALSYWDGISALQSMMHKFSKSITKAPAGAGINTTQEQNATNTSGQKQINVSQRPRNGFSQRGSQPPTVPRMPLMELMGQLPLVKYLMLWGCYIPLKNRTQGFGTEDEAVKEAQDLDIRKDAVWGMIHFLDTGNDFRYEIITHYGLRNKIATLFLQSMIEAATVEEKTGKKVQLEQKLLPERCKKASRIYAPAFSVIAMVVGLGYIVIAYTIASEMCYEKAAGLIEFLLIAGVPRWKVKLAWLIFGAVCFVAVAIIVTCIFKFVSPRLLEYSDFSLVMILAILYSLSLLCMCFCIASLMSTAQRAGIVMFVSMMIAYLLPQWGQLVPEVGYTGGRLMLVRLATFLHAGVAAQIGFAYIFAWEQLENGVKWNALADSPDPEDQYGALLEVFFYLICQCFMYMLLSWYFDNVAPSKYGVKWPFYFCCMPSYWGGSQKKQKQDANSIQVQAADIEKVQTGCKAGISLKALTKSYGRGKIAVDQLSVTFYQNEITALLGHNGAGKSTTMNMLTGMITPTSGSATISEYDIWSNMIEVRKTLGFCPQYDIVYPELSVSEHMYFYGDLKRIPRDKVEEYSTALFQHMKMTHALDTPAMSLSGGMKRKLSIAIAFMGDPTVIILDEPTSAIDPFSRRAIWDTVLQYKSKATIVISTHYMQEADVLGDRIAIIDKGSLKCFGTPMYLKSSYGEGSKLKVAHQNVIDKKVLQDELQTYVPMTLQSSSTAETTYALPIEAARSPKLADAFKFLEEKGNQFGVISFGISESTMEQVFFNVAEGGGTNDQNQNGFTTQVDSLLGKIQYKNTKGVTLLLVQLWATWVKRFHLSKRSIVGFIFQVLTPLVFMSILLLMNNTIAAAGLGGETKLMHLWNASGQNALFYSGSHDSNFVRALINQGLGTKCMDGTVVPRKKPKNGEPNECLSLLNLQLATETTDKANITECDCSRCPGDAVNPAKNLTINSNDTLLNLNGRNISNYLLKTSEDNFIGGIEEIGISSNMSSLLTGEQHGAQFIIYRIWTGMKGLAVGRRRPTKKQLELRHMKAAFLNAFNNVLLRSFLQNNSTVDSKEYGITLYTKEVSMNKDLSITQRVNAILVGFFGHFALMMPTFTVLLIIVTERSSGNKQLQIIMGLNKGVYWLANFMWDMVLFVISVCLMIGFMSFWPKVFDIDLEIFFIISLMYGCSMILFGYVLSFLLNTARNAIMIIGNVSPYFALSCMILLNWRDEDWYEDINFSMCFLPPYFITEALIKMEFNKYDKDADPVLSWDVLGKRFVMSVLFSLFMLTFLICFEAGIITSVGNSFQSNSRKVDAQHNQDKDPDVLQEETKILNGSDPNKALTVKNLAKSFGRGKVAVRGVSFGVNKGECFGLLGVNGAGKTTLFKMLTRFHGPSRGDAKIMGKSVFTHPGEASKHMSYCPQQDCLFESLTASEHLHLYGRIRGVPSKQRKEVVAALIEEIGLTPHKKKQSHALSGGNKRKLNFAISITDFSDVIFLDEMTTGMDPKARRAAWICLEQAVARGCAAVITSHSMEECEALCNRIVIMVNGTFKCIGGIQYLKDKYGNNYNSKFRIGPAGHKENLINEMLQKFPQATIVEQHLGYVELQMPAEGLRLSSLFEAIHDLKKKCDIEEFSVSQTTLEHVFVNMVRDQE